MLVPAWKELSDGPLSFSSKAKMRGRSGPGNKPPPAPLQSSRFLFQRHHNVSFAALGPVFLCKTWNSTPLGPPWDQRDHLRAEVSESIRCVQLTSSRCLEPGWVLGDGLAPRDQIGPGGSLSTPAGGSLYFEKCSGNP